MAHTHRLVQIPGLRWFANTNTDANTEWHTDSAAHTYAYSDTNANSKSVAKCTEQLDRDRRVRQPNQFVVDGQFGQRDRLQD